MQNMKNAIKIKHTSMAWAVRRQIIGPRRRRRADHQKSTAAPTNWRRRRGAGLF